jgi:EAL domain-containing protein (putative c-di-GMP-specific phosphodiesterase class I)
MGMSLSPEDGKEAETLLHHSETALSRAKGMGSNNWQYYSKEVNQSMLFRVEMENSLRHALKRNELKLYYQPKLDLGSNLVVGCEALVRWQHPRLGLVHPKEFIPLAEEIGLIVPIGEWVLETACMQCKEWQQKGYPDFSMAVNLSARQFQRENVTHQVRQALSRASLHPSCLELELTESLTQYSDEAVGILAELAGMGVLIGVDDFGIGFSSLSYLKQLPISFIKIDQSFVSGIPTDAHDMAITTAIIELGHSLHLKVIAEGVEEADQMQFLKRLHCDLIQGYLIGKPNPEEIVSDYLGAKKFYVS